MEKDLIKIYGNSVRVRACGICWEDDKLLLVNHTSLTATNFWAPPGGGIEFGHSIDESLKREFLEETGLRVIPGKFLFGCEFIHKPLHAIELFYAVTVESGQLKAGADPEIQIIKAVRFMSSEEILAIPAKELHGIFRLIRSPGDLKVIHGFFRI